MPRKTRRQLVGKQEDAEREEREDALRALEQELHQEQENLDDPPSVVTEPMEMIGLPIPSQKNALDGSYVNRYKKN
jgi:hypothetical protein